MRDFLFNKAHRVEKPPSPPPGCRQAEVPRPPPGPVQQLLLGLAPPRQHRLYIIIFQTLVNTNTILNFVARMQKSELQFVPTLQRAKRSMSVKEITDEPGNRNRL